MTTTMMMRFAASCSSLHVLQRRFASLSLRSFAGVVVAAVAVVIAIALPAWLLLLSRLLAPLPAAVSAAAGAAAAAAAAVRLCACSSCALSSFKCPTFVEAVIQNGNRCRSLFRSLALFTVVRSFVVSTLCLLFFTVHSEGGRKSTVVVVFAVNGQ